MTRVMLVAVVALLALPVLVVGAAAPAPVPLSELHLDQPSGTFSAGAGQGSGCNGNHPYSVSVHVALSAAADGSAVIGFSGVKFGPYSGPVMEGSPGQLQFNATDRSSSTATEFVTVAGIGTTFTGQGGGTVSGRCTVTAPATLTLAGSGLTLLASSPSASAAPSTAPGATPSPSAPPTTLQQTCAQTVNSSASALLSADQASVTTPVPDQGTVSGTLAFEGGGGSGTGIDFPLAGPPPALLADSSGATVTCADACIFAFDGGGGTGNGIDYHPSALPPPELADSTGQSCPFDTGGGTGNGIDDPLGPGGAVAQLAAAVVTAATPTAPPVGTVLASAQATYPAAGTHTLVLPLSAAGRTLLQQLKAADAQYFAGQPGGRTPPYARLRLTLTFTPAAASGPTVAAGSFPVVIVVLVVLVAALGAASVVLRNRRTRGTSPS